MLNYIWMGMILISVVVGTFTGRIDQVTQAAIDMAKLSVEIAIGLVGIMALWLGIMKIAEASGLIRIIAKLLRPITIRLFPDVPDDHPAIGSIVLNMSANMLGLGNAATPLGLKAMEELQELNPDKKTASNAMVMFLAINTSSVQLILPATVVALMGVVSADIFITTILATLCSTIAAIVIVKVLENTKWFRLTPAPEDGAGDEASAPVEQGEGDER
ncbi:nucleoside recognition protein [Marinihelvus fidelis]|uniref:Nucleoside recognition protein n=1 Tax=Marinihelvus fidelis TaxID=2613842 RepID=A0A5N0TCH2_9GAMM|nr:nucleoside recognition domain-containing protein [Marinihelvus fidelis]KAA9132793.1 nucleoside recognition protein [Marinihelvus fidelis]